ncbi:hypothetical protein CONPUDRAFT_153851 [Coniophora puteana RWD-64-598 SS2]|uniref:Uncharacterized protein n=1 Tax=Coniophora puteana (strain RWD-64-598) TaxID=741705 RepID=A0A5M3MQ45_CONPW|nr:uncharacterized protein CONPUDRAFT_153851 [Coniophora puteana RWD-64-598 SS2]EIW81302.1 hypothetical protein CONPUDRAFT_153851 [Coniophora puteana RWD-64-598 SS2]
MDSDSGHGISAKDLSDRLEQIQMSSGHSNEDTKPNRKPNRAQKPLLPAHLLPHQLNPAKAHLYNVQRPRKAYYGFAVTSDAMVDHALRWYEGRFTREDFDCADLSHVEIICVGAAAKHLELNPEHRRLEFPLVETPDGLRPCIAIYNSHERSGWNLDAEKESEQLEFIRSELRLPETQEAMWYFANCR